MHQYEARFVNRSQKHIKKWGGGLGNWNVNVKKNKEEKQNASLAAKQKPFGLNKTV